jgi:hypothetical protein
VGDEEWLENVKGRGQLRILGVKEKIIFRFMSAVELCAVFNWLKIRSSGGFLWTRGKDTLCV